MVDSPTAARAASATRTLPPEGDAPERADTAAAPPAHVPGSADDGLRTLRSLAQDSTQPQFTAAGIRQGPVAPGGAGSLAAEVRGTTQRPIDLSMAQMANDVYSATPGQAQTNTQSERELNQAGWYRVQPGQVLTTPDGRSFQLDAKQLSDASSGFQAAVYQNRNTGGVVVAFAGTDPASMGDIRTDVGQGLGLQTRQYEMAAALGSKVVGAFGTENVAFTGHSLGGGLAAVATLATDAQGVTFNAAGLSNETLREYGNPNSLRDDYASNGALRSYSVAGDPLTALGHSGLPQPVGTELQMPNVKGSRNPITVHGGGGDGQLYVEGLRADAAQPKPADGLSDRLTQQSRQAALNTLGNVVDAGLGLVGDARHIGSETWQDLRRAVQQPDLFTPARVVAEVADGGLQAAGALTDRFLDGVGREASVVTDALGQGARELVRGTPWEGQLDGLAGRLEAGGQAARHALDQAGNEVRAFYGRAGDLVSSLPGHAQDAAATAVAGGAQVAATAWAGARDVAQIAAHEQAVVRSTIVNAAGGLLHSAAGGASDVAGAGLRATVDTARSAATGIQHVATTAGQQVQRGAQELAHGDIRQAARTLATAPARVLSVAASEGLRHLGQVADAARSVVSTAASRGLDVARTAISGTGAVVSSMLSGAGHVARSAVDSGRAVLATAAEKTREVAAKLNPFNWSF